MTDSFESIEWNAWVEAINLDTVMAKLHVFHLCDILNAIKSWLWKSADFLVMREIAAVINMQTSSRWRSRLRFENPIYFCVIIYLPVHSLQSLVVPSAHITQLHSHLYLRRCDCMAESRLPFRGAIFCLEIVSLICSGSPWREFTAGACQISALPFGYDDSVNGSLTKRLRPQFYKLAPDKLLSWRRCSRWRWGGLVNAQALLTVLPEELWI